MKLANRSNNSGSTGLNIDGGYVAAVVVDDGVRVSAATSLDLPEGVVVEGEVRDPLRLTEAIKAMFDARKLPKTVRLGIANQQVVVREIELPVIEDDDDRAAAVRFQAAEAIPMPMDEAVMDFVELGAAISPDGKARTRVMVVAARRTMIEMLVESVKAAGLKPEGVDLDSFALVRTLAMPEEPTDSAIVHCHLGGIVNLAIAVGRDCHFARALAMGVLDAEAGAAQALAEEIRLSSDAYAQTPGTLPVSAIRLSGPGADAENLAADLAEATGIDVTVAPPLGLISPAGIPPDEDPRRLTVATGLALGAAA